MPSANLEIGLRWDRRHEALMPNLRLELPGDAEDQWKQPEDPLELNLDQLRQLTGDPRRYGKALAGMLLRREDILPFYRHALGKAEALGIQLHLRLHITAPSFVHAVRWETLVDPETDERVALGERVLMSRYLSSAYGRSVPARERRQLRAVVAVAGPDLGDHHPNGRVLDDVNVDEEIERGCLALDALSDIRVLPKGGVTLDALVAAVEEGVDVVYLVCHGALVGDVPVLYLDGPDGGAERVEGRRFVEKVVTLERRPAVMMLCSCQSASRGDEIWTNDNGEIAALGPRLASEGVASVVAMQGDFSIESAKLFVPAFFTELNQHGFVDRAMAEARRKIDHRPDWWAPVLYTRLRSGRTYWRPEFGSRGEKIWSELKLQIDTGYLVPVLGPGLADSILGSRQEIAHDWVTRWQIPLASRDRGDLAQVAQYLRVRTSDAMVRGKMLEHLSDEIKRRAKAAEPSEPFHGLGSQSVSDAIREAGRRQRANDPGEPYAVVASLPVKIFVTTAWTDLLQDALREADPPKDPITKWFMWHRPTDPRAGENVEPTIERPLVYHLFGRLEDRRSLVLTEDDYFAWYAAWLGRRSVEVPDVVLGALVDQALLYLGFQLSDWDFSVAFQGIKSFAGARAHGDITHVGVQLSPDDQRIEPDVAQDYLESRFGVDNVGIYWGQTRSFLDELNRQLAT